MNCPKCKVGKLESVEGRGVWTESGPSQGVGHVYHFDCGHSTPAPSIPFLAAVIKGAE